MGSVAAELMVIEMMKRQIEGVNLRRPGLSLAAVPA
jgi:hypothetical protein